MKQVSFKSFQDELYFRLDSDFISHNDYKLLSRLLVDCNLIKDDFNMSPSEYVDNLTNSECFLLCKETFSSIDKAVLALLNSESITNPTTRAKLAHKNFMFI